AKADRDVAQVAHRGAAVADLDVADGPLAAGDAVEEVLVAIGARGEVHGAFGEGPLDDLGRVTRGLVPSDVKVSLGAGARGATGDILLILAARDRHAAGVRVGDAAGARDFIPVLGVELGRGLGGDRAGVVGAHRPLGDVEVVGAEVGHLAAG